MQENKQIELSGNSGQLKFRAVIKEHNVVEHFTMQNLVTNDFFTMREIVKPWLAKGNLPDRYTGFKDKDGRCIFEGDYIIAKDYPFYHLINKN